MIGYQYKFDKILSIREKEKKDALSKYNNALRVFEEAAEKLYRMLKKKEDLQAFQLSKMEEGLPVMELRHHQMFMDNLEKMIDHYQREVMKARQIMQTLQAVLLDKNVEVKKFQKIREKDYAKFQTASKLEEKLIMDDLSIQAFLSKGK